MRCGFTTVRLPRRPRDRKEESPLKHIRSRSPSALGREIQRVLGPRALVLTDRADLVAYSYDATGGQALPDAVVFPADTACVASLIGWAARRGMPVVARGAGTNLSGGTVPVHGGVVVEFSRLCEVLEVDLPGRRAVVQPGITTLALRRRLEPLGYTFAPDPASQNVSTLGGNAAENSGGPHCLKYGVTADHVVGFTAVLADGEVVRWGYGPGPDLGLDAVGVLVGSEGTLAIFTELVVRLEPVAPAAKTLLAVYDCLEDAGRTVSEIIARGILPATLELIDRPTMLAVEESFAPGYPTDAEGVLLIETDGLAPGLARQATAVRAICIANGARSVQEARDEEQRERLWLGRRAALGALARLSPVYSLQDATVPRDRLVQMMRAVQRISRAHGLETAIVAHAGDGNLHPIILYRESSPARLAAVRAANREILTAAVELGGTITGEHGVGLDKLDCLPLALTDAAVEVMARLKRSFDPLAVLNPGKAVVMPGVPAASARSTASPNSAAGSAGRRAGDPAGRLAAFVKGALAAGAAVLPRGLGTRKAWAPAPDGKAVEVSTDDLLGISALDRDNLSLTVWAGTPSSVLRSELAAAGFWLPPLDHRWCGSVGGDVATNVHGPLRAVFGGVGRWLLGAQLVDGTGQVVDAGGRTMKNVAGYDLLRVLAGSQGRIGLLTKLTFKVWPVPERDVTLCCPFAEAPEAELHRLAEDSRPAAVVAAGTVVSPAEGPQGALLIRLCGLAEDVAWAQEQWMRSIPALSPLDAEEADRAWGDWVGPYAAAAETGELLRFGVPAGEACAAARALGAGGDEREPFGPGFRWSMCLLSGTGSSSGRHAAGTAVAEVFRDGRGWVRAYGAGRGWEPGPLDGRIAAALDPQGSFWPAVRGDRR